MGKSRLSQTAGFDLADFKASEAFGAYEAFHSGTMLGGPVDSNNGLDTHVASSIIQLGGLVLGDVRACAIMQSTRPEVRKTLLPELLTVRIYLNGADVGQIGDTTARLTPGPIHIFPLNYLLLTPQTSRFISCCLPFDLVGYEPGRHADYLSLPKSAPIARILGMLIQQAAADADRLSEPERETIGASICSIVRTILGGQTVDEETTSRVAHQRAVAMRQYVEREIADEKLGVDTLCKAFNVSRAVAYRAFESEGGINTFMRRVRLARACRDLMIARVRPTTVSEVRLRWGFSDPSYFAKVFRETYGISPRDALAARETERGVSRSRDAKGFRTDLGPLVDLYGPVALKRSAE